MSRQFISLEKILIPNPGIVPPLFLKPAQAGFVRIVAVSTAESYRGYLPSASLRPDLVSLVSIEIDVLYEQTEKNHPDFANSQGK
jgi:hypothetical protein